MTKFRIILTALICFIAFSLFAQKGVEVKRKSEIYLNNDEFVKVKKFHHTNDSIWFMEDGQTKSFHMSDIVKIKVKNRLWLVSSISSIGLGTGIGVTAGIITGQIGAIAAGPIAGIITIPLIYLVVRIIADEYDIVYIGNKWDKKYQYE